MGQPSSYKQHQYGSDPNDSHAGYSNVGDVGVDLTAVARLGPFFTLTTGTLDRADWKPVRSLYDDGEDLSGLVDRVGTALGTHETRVAVSILVQGYAARLWAIGLGALTDRGMVPDLDPERLLWRDHGGSIRLHLRPAHGWYDGDLPNRLAVMIVDDHLAVLIRAVRRLVPISARLLWDNSTSALYGAARILDDGPMGAVAALAGHLLARQPGGTPGIGADGSYRRRSCCLYYRVDEGGLCGDCVFSTPPGPPTRKER